MNTRKLIKHAASASLIAGLMLPFAAAALTQDPFGVGYGRYTGLSSADIRVTIAEIIRTAMSLLGIVAVLIVLYGGFKWMTSAGNEEEVGKAKQILTAGIVIVIMAYGITNAVIKGVTTGDIEGAGGGAASATTRRLNFL